MSSHNSRMADAATQTDIVQTIATAPPTPPAAAPSPSLANDYIANPRPSRRERRGAFWAPISAKMKDRREARQRNEVTADSRAVIGTNKTDSQGRASRAGSPTYDHQTHGWWPSIGSQAQSHIVIGQSIGPTHSRTPRRSRHMAGAQHLCLIRGGSYAPQIPFRDLVAHETLGPSHHAFMDNLHDTDRNGVHSASRIAYPGQLHEHSPSSATHVGSVGRPVLTLTPTDADGQSSWIRPVSDQAEVARTVFGAPPSPQIPSTRINEDLDSISGGLFGPPLMPDPESSGSATRMINNDWDGKTQVADTQEQSQPGSAATEALPSSEELKEMLFRSMKEPVVALVDRSWTFPGRERCLQFSVGTFLEDTKTLEDAKTLVEEPVEAFPKTNVVRKERLRPVNSVENFLSLPPGASWISSF